MTGQVKSGQGGQAGFRGCEIHAISCLLDAFEVGNDWKSVTLEPFPNEEKIDILWDYGHKKKVVQVKSRQARFTQKAVRYNANELRGSRTGYDEYEMALAGEVDPSLIDTAVGGVKIKALPNDLDVLLKLATNSLDVYLYEKGISNVSPQDKRNIVNQLKGELFARAARGLTLTAGELDRQIKSSIREHTTPRIAALENEIREAGLTKRVYGTKIPRDLLPAVERFLEGPGAKFSKREIGQALPFLTAESGRLGVRIPALAYVAAAFFTMMGVELVFKSLWDVLRQPASTPAQHLLNTAYPITCVLIAAFLIHNSLMPILTARCLHKVSRNGTP